MLMSLMLVTYFPSHGQDYTFFNLNIEDGLAHNNIYELFQDRDGYLWIGAGPKLQRYDGHNFLTFEHEFNNPSSLTFGDILTINQDVHGTIWIGTDGGGMSEFKNGTFKTHKASEAANSLNSNNIEIITELPDSSLYIGTWGGGINILKNGKYTYLTHNKDDIHSISGNKITGLYYDKETETLWIGTWENGLCYMKNGVITRIPYKTTGFDSYGASNITKTADGTIWLLGREKGLYSYKDGLFSNHRFKVDDYAGNNINSLNAVGDKLWMGTYGEGIMLLEDGNFTYFNKKEAPHKELKAEFVESSFIDHNGNFWVGTYGEGMTKVVERQKPPPTKAVSQITNISIADSSVFWMSNQTYQSALGAPQIKVPLHQEIVIEFSDMFLGGDKDVFFKYRMSKIHANWSEYTTASSVSFGSLKPGNYIFEVMASYDHQNWSPPAQISLQIEGIWYETLAFKLGVAVIVFLLILALVRIRINALIKRNAKLNTLVKQKTREIKAQNKRIRQNADILEQTNVELKQALNELGHLKKQEAIFNQNEKSVTSRELHDNISTRLFSIRQKLNDYLKRTDTQKSEPTFQNDIDKMIKSLISDSQIIMSNLKVEDDVHASFYDSVNALIEELSTITSCQINLNWEGKHHILDLKTSANLFRIIKESLANAIRHSQADLISLHINNQDELISLVAEDNGVGFNLSKQKLSRGIVEIFQRAQELKTDIQIKTKPKQGTRIELAVVMNG